MRLLKPAVVALLLIAVSPSPAHPGFYRFLPESPFDPKRPHVWGDDL